MLLIIIIMMIIIIIIIISSMYGTFLKPKVLYRGRGTIRVKVLGKEAGFKLSFKGGK